MIRVFEFVKQFFPFLLFIALEITAISFIVKKNKYHQIKALSILENFTYNVFNIKSKTLQYVNLRGENERLIKENTELLNKIHQGNEISNTNSYQAPYLDSNYIRKDSNQISFLSASIVHNTFLTNYNYFIIDKGKKNNVQENSGVLAHKNPIGIVVDVSSNFSLCISLLNIKTSLSVKLKQGGVGLMHWSGDKSPHFTVNYINKNLSVEVGDTLVTSGFSTIFPANYPVGKVVKIEDNIGTSFYILKVELFNDIKSTEVAYVCRYEEINEIDSLKNLIVGN